MYRKIRRAAHSFPAAGFFLTSPSTLDLLEPRPIPDPLYKVALMPFMAWGTRPESKAFLTRLGEGLAGKEGGTSEGDGEKGERGLACVGSGGVSDLFDPRVAAWMLDTGSSTDKTLEFEALCVAWLKDQAGKAGELFHVATSTSVPRPCYFHGSASSSGVGRCLRSCSYLV